jgi:hypothetical protein
MEGTMEYKAWLGSDQEYTDREYETPELIRYGTVFELTQTGAATE